MIINNGPKMGPCGTTTEQVFGNHNLGIFMRQTDSNQHIEKLDYLLTACNYDLFSKTAVVMCLHQALPVFQLHRPDLFLFPLLQLPLTLTYLLTAFANQASQCQKEHFKSLWDIIVHCVHDCAHRGIHTCALMQLCSCDIAAISRRLLNA